MVSHSSRVGVTCKPVKSVNDALMSADADAVCDAPYGIRSDERTNSCNGCRVRDWDTRAATPPTPTMQTTWFCALSGHRNQERWLRLLACGALAVADGSPREMAPALGPSTRARRWQGSRPCARDPGGLAADDLGDRRRR